MTPKEKAQELFDKYYLATYDTMDVLRIKSKNLAITCALIAVDELIGSHYHILSGIKPSVLRYWEEVSKEIKKI